MNTVTEAIALGTLLRWVMLDHSQYGLLIPTAEEAKEAAALLAEKAEKTGACCYNAAAVERLWPLRHRCVHPLERHCAFCHKAATAVDMLISSPDEPRVYICDECINVCFAALGTTAVTKKQRKAGAAAKVKESTCRTGTMPTENCARSR